jgi:hypothetical protein
MTGFDSKRRIALDRLDDDDIQVYAKPHSKRPIESDYTSQVAYTRALELFCDTLAQPVQEPLTDKQILADETLRYYFGQNGGAGPVSKKGRRVVDAIEAAHGIKENT